MKHNRKIKIDDTQGFLASIVQYCLLNKIPVTNDTYAKSSSCAISLSKHRLNNIIDFVDYDLEEVIEKRKLGAKIYDIKALLKGKYVKELPTYDILTEAEMENERSLSLSRRSIAAHSIQLIKFNDLVNTDPVVENLFNSRWRILSNHLSVSINSEEDANNIINFFEKYKDHAMLYKGNFHFRIALQQVKDFFSTNMPEGSRYLSALPLDNWVDAAINIGNPSCMDLSTYHNVGNLRFSKQTDILSLDLNVANRKDIEEVKRILLLIKLNEHPRLHVNVYRFAKYIPEVYEFLSEMDLYVSRSK